MGQDSFIPVATNARPRNDLVETTEEFHELERQIRLELRDSWRGTK